MLKLSHLSLLLVLTASLFVFGCDGGGDDDPPPPPPQGEVPGLVLTQSDTTALGTFNRLSREVQNRPTVDPVATVNHTTNAQNVGETLRPTFLVLAGTPEASTPLVEINQVVGIDLPQRLLVLEDAAGDVFVAYDDPEYIAARHGVGGASALEQIRNALQLFAVAGTNGTVSEPAEVTTQQGAGLISVQSNADAATTYDRLRAAIAANANLSIVAEVDHEANAASVGVDIRPTKLIVFGNPALGTPLMQSRQTVGIDLPQKMLVYTDASGATRVVYNNPQYIADRHGATGVDDQITSIRTALEGFAATAAGN